MNVAIEAGDTSTSRNMSSKPRGTYLDPLKACALSGMSECQAGKSESSTYTKFMGIVRQTRRTASRTSVLNDVEKTRFSTVMKRIDSEKAYSTSVLERQVRMFRKSLIDIEKHKVSLLKRVEGQNKERPDIDEQTMGPNNSVSDSLRRHKGRSRKRGARSRRNSKKRIFNTKLPSISNQSILESEDEDVANEITETSTSDHQKPSKRTHGGLTLPVFMKTGDSSKTTSSSFYTGNEQTKERKNSEDRSLKCEKLKLPAINFKEQGEWT